jgi:hypothetical protein
MNQLYSVLVKGITTIEDADMFNIMCRRTQYVQILLITCTHL